MKKFVIAILLVVLSGCAGAPKKPAENDFKIDFGKIIEVGGYYQIEKQANEFQISTGQSEGKFGVRIENLARNPYDLAFYISRLDKASNQQTLVDRGGYWKIAPPNNPDYEAFLWESDKTYQIGSYIFVVLVAGEAVKTIEFEIVNE